MDDVVIWHQLTAEEKDGPGPCPSPTAQTEKGNEMEARTEKGQGIQALSSALLLYNLDLSISPPPPTTFFPQSKHSKYPVFARPCPSTPVHGFLESRLINDAEDLADLAWQVGIADPDGEIALQPRLAGEYSGVVTRARVTWAKGHDGVTSGTSKAESIPVSYSREQEARRLGEVPGVSLAPSECFYVEMVTNAKQTHLVQLRRGPTPPSTSGDYIPKKITISTIASPIGLSLNEWPNYLKRMLEYTGGPGGGLVIALDEHLSMESHWAIHGVIMEIPIIFSNDLALVGTTREPTVEVKTLSPGDYKRIADHLQWRLLQKPTATENALSCCNVALAQASVHGMHHWGAEPATLRLRGLAAADCFLYVATACIGENRYFYRKGPGGKYMTMYETETDDGGHKLFLESVVGKHLLELHPGHKYQTKPGFRDCKMDWRPFFGDKWKNLIFGGSASIEGATARSKVYQTTHNCTFRTILNAVEACAEDFQDPGWSNDDSCGFGGPKWGEAAELCAELGHAIEDFLAAPNKNHWRDLAQWLNLTSEAAHNGGRIYTKWLSSGSLDVIAKFPTVAFMAPNVGPTILGKGEHKLLFSRSVRKILFAEELKA